LLGCLVFLGWLFGFWCFVYFVVLVGICKLRCVWGCFGVCLVLYNVELCGLFLDLFVLGV
jgi:hypothetical protein